jgi:thiol-disulfide isomerase/thioredoxin
MKGSWPGLVALLAILGGCAPAVDSGADAGGDASASAPTPSSSADSADEAKDAGRELLAVLAKKPPKGLMDLAFTYDEELSAGSSAASRQAKQLLAVVPQAVKHQQAADYIAAVAQDDPIGAAKLLLWVVRAETTSAAFDDAPIALGRLIVADGKYPASDVLAQVPITSEGYFATELGSLARPLAFRAPGYADLDVPLRDGAAGDDDADAPRDARQVVIVGDVTLQPLAADQRATLHGRLHADDASRADTAQMEIDLDLGKSNTPHGGYSPRRSWPDAQPVKLGAEGEFTIEGLNPSKYTLMAAAKEHSMLREEVALTSGETNVGELRLRSTNLGFYIHAPAPNVPELAWEGGYDAALARARAEHRPLMVMMTATWCGPCKMLERNVLSNVWVRAFLEPFVVVQAFEDRRVEQKYQQEVYPTLVFCNSDGEEKFRTEGYMPPVTFVGQVAQALVAVGLNPPAELQTLIDQGVVKLGENSRGETADAAVPASVTH